MAIEINSLKNPRIKFLTTLEKSRDRREAGLFLIEGVREISLAQQSGYELEEIYACPEIFKQDPDYPISLEIANLFHVSKEVFSKVAYREKVGGIIALAKIKDVSLRELTIQPKGIYLILEKVEKPGNLGAMLRTADAAGIDGVIICDPATDFYNPNVVRSSVGCLFTVPIASGTNEEVLKWARQNSIEIYAAALSATKPYYDLDYSGATAILMGSEADGLSKFWLESSIQQIIIPMAGKIDSMNVSNAAAILLFEVLRQRAHGA